mgnify:FL=1
MWKNIPYSDVKFKNFHSYEIYDLHRVILMQSPVLAANFRYEDNKTDLIELDEEYDKQSWEDFLNILYGYYDLFINKMSTNSYIFANLKNLLPYILDIEISDENKFYLRVKYLKDFRHYKGYGVSNVLQIIYSEHENLESELYINKDYYNRIINLYDTSEKLGTEYISN